MDRAFFTEGEAAHDAVARSYSTAEKVGFALIVALVSRVAFLLLAWLFVGALGNEESLSDALCRWDCGWYMSIVEGGYNAEPFAHAAGDAANWAFFPLFPLLASAVQFATGLSAPTAGLIVSNLCFVAAVPILLLYIDSMLDARCAWLAIGLLSFSPYSLYFSVQYTESLFFLLLVSVLYAARSNRWLVSALCAALLSATRSPGAFVVFPLLLIGVSRYGWRDILTIAPGTERFFLAVFAAPLGLFLFMAYLDIRTGDAFAFMHIQIAWGRSFSNVLSDPGQYWIYATVLIALAGITAILVARDRRLLADAVVLLTGVLIPLSTGLDALPRYALANFPFYLALAILLRRHPRGGVLAVIVFASLIGFFAFSWVSGRSYMT